MATMNGINDFQVPLYMDIVHPDRGFFGYLLRCKCPMQEEFDGDFILLENGTNCCKRFPTIKRRREEIRAEWNNRINSYQDIFQSQLYYVKEELIEEFYDFMTRGSDDEVRKFLERFMEGVSASVIYNTLELEPLYAVSHVNQFADGDCIHCPHIHVLWGIKKK